MKRLLTVFVLVPGLMLSWSMAMAGDLDVIPVKGQFTSWDKKISGSTRFKLVLDGEAVLDRETGLVWERSLCSTFAPPGVCENDWKDACLECYRKKLGGRMGWRLPTAEELTSLVDTQRVKPALPQNHPFNYVRAEFYWSSTTYPGFNPPTPFAILVSLYYGGTGNYNKTAAIFYTWCVRGGYGHDGY